MSDALSAKLASIELEAERKKNWIKFIYSLIEDNLCEYQWIFHTQEQEINLAKEIISKELEKILKFLIDKETALCWIDLLCRKRGIPNRGDTSVILGFTEFKSLKTREEMEKEARTHILWNKKKNFTKWLLSIFKNENEIKVTKDEIEHYIDNSIWSYTQVLTQKWREIINAYLKSIWRDKIDVIKKRVKLACEI